MRCDVNGSCGPGDHALVVNQIIATTIATRMAPHTIGVTRFELPLRGESFGAWLNSLSMDTPAKKPKG
jgi:hypothetical protein